MTCDLPDLQKIYAIAEDIANGDLFSDLGKKGQIFTDISLDIFRQIWPNTACGFSEPGMMTGQAFTEEYTTVAAIKKVVRDKKGHHKSEEAYVVFFGNRGAYIVTDPKPAFFEDLKKRHMSSKYDAMHGRY